ncbi:hypothetical protein BH20ACI4_BH20ACI4_17320 [soil metagenome]
MNEETKIIRDDVYEEIAATFQCVEVLELDKALKDCGIESKELRRKICDRYFFAIGNFHDQYWFEAEGKKFHPMLCFSETFLDTDTDETKLGTVYAKSQYFEFHEYSGGAVDIHFDEEQNDNPIEFGIVDTDETFSTK